MSVLCSAICFIDTILLSISAKYTSLARMYTVSTSELETLGDKYDSNDTVGKSGIEKSMESVLSGTKGERQVYVDTVGRITEVLGETDPETGNDVYLTIDINLQKNLYNAIEDRLVQILLTYMTSGDTKYCRNSFI